MSNNVYKSCMDYSREYSLTFLQAFVALYEGSDMPDSDYEAIFDYIEASERNYICI